MNRYYNDVMLYLDKAQECLEGDKPDTVKAKGYINGAKSELKSLNNLIVHQTNFVPSSAYKFPNDAKKQLRLF